MVVEEEEEEKKEVVQVEAVNTCTIMYNGWQHTVYIYIVYIKCFLTPPPLFFLIPPPPPFCSPRGVGAQHQQQFTSLPPRSHL